MLHCVLLKKSNLKRLSNYKIFRAGTHRRKGKLNNTSDTRKLCFCYMNAFLQEIYHQSSIQFEKYVTKHIASESLSLNDVVYL